MKYKIIFLISVVLSSVSCYDKFDDYEQEDKEHVYRNMRLEDVRTLYSGSSATVNRKVTLGGYVTANDLTGNFYKTFIIDDGSGAIEVKAGTYYLFNNFPEGRYVTIKAEGLTVGSYNGVIQIGLKPQNSSSYQVEYFGHESLLKKYVSWEYLYNQVEPIDLTIPELTENLCGRLIRICDLTADAGVWDSWAAVDSDYGSKTGYISFKDVDDNKITVQSSSYASFANELVPQHRVSITGILLYNRTNGFNLKIRSLYDVE